MVYPGNLRFLKGDDILRSDTTSFPLKEKDLSIPPELKSTEYVDSANEDYLNAESDRERK